MIGKYSLALLSVALLAGGCASSGARAPQSGVKQERVAPSSPRDRAEARRQLAYYIAQLESGRRALGIDAERRPWKERHIAPAVPAPSAGRRDAAASESEAVTSTKRARPRRAPRARVSAAPPPATAGAPSADDAAGAPLRAEEARCPMDCRHARAICHAARHICKLADYLDEDDARIRCGRAQEDCRRARERTRGQCHACD